MLRALNAAAAWGLGSLIQPFADAPPLVGLAVVALLAAALVLVIARLTSDQAAVMAARRGLRAALLEMRLFQDEPRLLPRSVAALLREQIRYLRAALVPMLWASLPLALLLVHLESYFGHQGLDIGATTVVSARLRAERSSAATAVVLAGGRGVRVETPAVHIPARHELSWRIRMVDPREAYIEIGDGAIRIRRPVCVSARLVACDPERPAPGFQGEWRHPSEPRLPADGPFETIAIGYPRRAVTVLGVDVPWLAVFFLLTALFAWLAQPLLRVKL